MNRLLLRGALLGAAVICLLPALAGDAFAGRAAQGPSRAIATAPIRYRFRRLSNGLSVYSIENRKTPTVAIQVWYNVGGKNDPEGRSGFAHLFEHLMFKSTRNMAAETMDRLTEAVGGENNAYTTEDRTVYHETVPSNYLETLLWAEADRMAHLNVDEPDFFSERAVVEEEFRQSVLAPPYGRLFELINSHSYREHPYHRGVIGSIADLDSAGIEDVRRFHRTFYRPDNAMLIVSGDFDPAALDSWVDRYFGKIEHPADAIPRVSLKEPARTGEQRFDEHGPNVPLPAVVIDYLTPPAAGEDAAALRVAAQVLSAGDSSILQRSLVYDAHIASSVSASASLHNDAGLFEFFTVAAGGKSIDDVERATRAEIEKFKSSTVSEADLSRARAQLLAGALRRRETAAGQAGLIGDAVATLGDPERANTEIDRLQAVTSADVQRVARKYFTPENSVIIHYSAGDQEQGGRSVHPSAPVTNPAQAAAGRELPPQPAAARKITLPKPAETRLANGLKIITITRPKSGLVTVRVIVKAGASSDPANMPGLADFTAQMLARGTATQTAEQIARAAEICGGSIAANAGWDSSSASITVLSNRLDRALDVLSDVVLHPSFPAGEVDSQRTETLDDLTVRLRSPGTLANSVLTKVVLGGTPYGHPIAGTPASVRGITTSALSDFYHGHYGPANSVIVFTGDVTPQDAARMIEHRFGGWTGSASAAAAPISTIEHGATGRLIVVDKPDAGQAAVMLGLPGIRRTDPEYVTARVTDAILGDGYSSRINQEIRIKRGLSYGASSQFDARRSGGIFLATAQTRNDAVTDVVGLLKQEVGRIATDPISTEEITQRKASLSGSYARRLETSSGLNGILAEIEAADVPIDSLRTYLAKIQGVTEHQVRTFARTRLPINQATIVVVGDSRRFLPGLRARFGNVEVIPVANLSLDAGGLTRAPGAGSRTAEPSR